MTIEFFRDDLRIHWEFHQLEFWICNCCSVRLSVVTASGLMALGTCLRCIKFVVPSVSDAFFTATCHICAAFCGVSGIVFCSAPALVSATWLTAGERVTSTSVSLVSLCLGSGVSWTSWCSIWLQKRRRINSDMKAFKMYDAWTMLHQVINEQNAMKEKFNELLKIVVRLLEEKMEEKNT